MRVLLVLIFLVFTATVSAKTLEPIEELKLKLDSIKTLSGEFQQTIKDAKGAAVQEPSHGHFTLKRPGYFLWESDEPFAQLIIGSPEELKVYEPDLEQLTLYPRQQNDQNNPVHLLSGDLSTLRESFGVSSEVAKKKLFIYTLLPIKNDSAFKQVKFHFTKNTLSELQFVDKLDQTTRIVFSKLESNKNVKDELFNFVAPAGTDIIKND